MSGDRKRQTVIALALSVVGMACGAWLLVQALGEITVAVSLPRGAR